MPDYHSLSVRPVALKIIKGMFSVCTYEKQETKGQSATCYPPLGRFSTVWLSYSVIYEVIIKMQ